MSAEPPVFPKALADDADDVAWALQTAGVQWERGGHADAVVWLRRAAQAALELGEFGRAADLEKIARQIDLWLKLGESSGFARQEEDDGVDALLDEDMPVVEAHALDGPTPSLVDAMELEARSEAQAVEEVEELDEVEELQDEEIIEELDEEPSDGAGPPLPSFPLDSVAPPPVGVEPGEDSEAEEIEARELESSHEQTGPASIPLSLVRPSASPPAAERVERSPESVKEPASGPLVGREPEPMPPIELRESEPPPRMRQVGTEQPESGPPAPVAPSHPAGDTDAITLKPPAALPARTLPGPSPELEPEVSDEEIDLPQEPAAPAFDAARLYDVKGLEDLTPEIHAALAARARVTSLVPEQEVGGYGLLWVMSGSVMVMPTITDAVVGFASEGQTIFSRGSLATGVALRAVAGPGGAEVSVWQPEDFQWVLEKCPWVADDLRAIADRFQALAGAAMGLLGERLDDSMRAMVTDRCEVKVLLPGDVVFEKGKPVVGLYVIGAGEIELDNEGTIERTLGPGDLLFPSAVLTHAPAPASARASAGGALVLFADRMATHELVVSVPPLLELVATA